MQDSQGGLLIAASYGEAMAGADDHQQFANRQVSVSFKPQLLKIRKTRGQYHSVLALLELHSSVVRIV